ncbi:MAG: YhcH/YjgK/YiaL family protein [Candidatus Lokiarchaeota archaeon]|nr:YhcH/YjgK/YiaL family protein [Candidatus Lokiarchaeota archaeon]
MFCDTIASWRSAGAGLHASIKAALGWIEANKENPPADATIPLEGGARVIVQSYEPKGLGDARFENHHKFVDVQYVVSGAEVVYWTKARRGPVTSLYSEEKDVEFFEMVDPAANSTGLLLEAGMFAVLWPGDWHLPCIDPAVAHPSYALQRGMVKKFVVKVPA